MPAFPGMPYSAAPAWAFPVFEVSLYLALALCIVHAIRSGRKFALPYLAGGLIFGLILEYLEVLSHSYTYGHFWIMFGHAPLDIPLCIGCGWAIILYTSRLFSDAVRLPLLASAAFDALLALNIDLSMDVVAYRLHMWHWYWTGSGLDPLRAQWFGIPWGNFNGWITVVFGYSLFSRLWERALARRSATTARFFGIAALALVCSQALLFVTESFVYPFLHDRLGIHSGPRLLGIIAILLLLTLLGLLRRRHPARAIAPLAMWIPCWFHVFFIAAFFYFRFAHESDAMTAAALVNVVLGLAVHLYPWKHVPLHLRESHA